ncbi:hypothetical protein ACSCBZ_46795 [Streptomyces niveiscabiei]|uniref:hypothetical protein n=1 Tax=Streptomyces niveiscabiei TaxID=164115 RepID=UPI0006EB52AB|nr:hypothetical protein [Streptomyces niveiscabiei]
MPDGTRSEIWDGDAEYLARKRDELRDSQRMVRRLQGRLGFTVFVTVLCAWLATYPVSVLARDMLTAAIALQPFVLVKLVRDLRTELSFRASHRWYVTYMESKFTR